MINREETEPLAKKVYYPQIKIKHAVLFGRLVSHYCNIIIAKIQKLDLNVFYI